MRVAVTEGPEFLVEALAGALRARGDEVVHLTRTPRRPDDRRWDPDGAVIDRPGLSDVDAVVNLYAATPWRRWTPAVREEIRQTRITGTLTIVNALEPDGRCRRFLNRSSTAFYGDRGADAATADTSRGHGFLALAVADWEASARHAAVPTVQLRTPAVLAPGAGYLDERRGLLRGRLGSGRQYLSWIHVADWVAAVLVLLDGTYEGPVNMSGPEPAREADFVAARARAERRRAALPVPDALLRARFTAEAARELWMTSTRAVPQVLHELGFVHRFGTLEAALADVAARASSGR